MMPHPDARSLGFAILLTGIALAAEAAPAPTPAQEPGVFKTVVPEPTGINGYEELVFAADLLAKNEPFRKVEADAAATLTEKRGVLANRDVKRVLALVKQGLGKSVFSPRRTVPGPGIPPEVAGFRRLGRLLAMQQYVLLADGQVSEALRIARQGLRLGRVVQTDSMITGLVGVAIGTSTLRSLGGHLDQLAVRDCDLLYQVCLEWLNQPDPLISMLEAERKVVKTRLAEYRKQFTQEAGGDLNPFAQAEKYADELFVRLFAEMRKAPWQRAAIDISDAPETAKGLLEPVITALQHSMRTYTREAAMVRLLACHARIRRHRWQQTQLPSSLGELRLGALAVDPFTGREFEYQALAREYRLVSAGPEAPGDAKAVNGRVPISVVPGES